MLMYALLLLWRANLADSACLASHHHRHGFKRFPEAISRQQFALPPLSGPVFDVDRSVGEFYQTCVMDWNSQSPWGYRGEAIIDIESDHAPPSTRPSTPYE
jgi:hypothetical protein